LLAVNVEVPLQLSTTVTVGVPGFVLVMQFLNLQHLYIHPILRYFISTCNQYDAWIIMIACIITPCDCCSICYPVTVNVDVPLQLSNWCNSWGSRVSLIVNIAGERLVLTHAFEPAPLTATA